MSEGKGLGVLPRTPTAWQGHRLMAPAVGRPGIPVYNGRTSFTPPGDALPSARLNNVGTDEKPCGICGEKAQLLETEESCKGVDNILEESGREHAAWPGARSRE